jgi:glucose/arabinose dehydrogenase
MTQLERPITRWRTGGARWRFGRRAGGVGAALVLGTSSLVLATAPVPASASPPSLPPLGTATQLAASTPQPIATGLDNPRHLTVGPDGALYVALAGTGGPANGPGSNCVPTFNEAQAPTFDCLGTTGSIARVTTSGSVSTVLAGLPSVVTEPAPTTPFLPPEYAGPAAVSYVNGDLSVVTQGTDLNPDGTNKFGAAGANLAKLITVAPGSASSTWSVGPDFAAYAAANPQSSESVGTAPGESPTDSDPYGITPYQGGFAVADAAANSLRFVSSSGVITTLATFPAQSATGAQAVPTSVVVGPDGALYVGELVGVDSAGQSPAGSAVVYRVVPGQQPTVYASGFSAITDLAFDRAGRLLVLEYDTNGLLDPTHNGTGAVIRVEANGTQTTLASTGLVEPTGLTVGDDGSIYVSDNGDTAGAGSIVRIPVPDQDGYQELASDGGAFTFGAYRFLGSLGAIKLNEPIVAGTSTRTSPGYWAVASDGGVFNFGTAGFYGSLGATKLNAPIVGIAATPDGRGYWLVAADGGVFTYGDAAFYGSTGNIKLNQPIVSIIASPDGGGYSLVAKDGGVFTFGDAGYFGSTGGLTLNSPIVGATATADGGGYWLVAADGGVFTFGDATFYGSTGNIKLNKPIVGIQAKPDDGGYWLVASDGGIFTFGDANFFGSTGGIALNVPIIGLS